MILWNTNKQLRNLLDELDLGYRVQGVGYGVRGLRIQSSTSMLCPMKPYGEEEFLFLFLVHYS